MNVRSPDTNKNTNKTDGCREYTEFASLISSFDLLPQTFAYAFNASRKCVAKIFVKTRNRT